MLGYVYMMPKSNIIYFLLLGNLVHLVSLSKNIDVQPSAHVLPKTDLKAPEVAKADERPEPKKEDIPTLSFNATKARAEPAKETPTGNLIFPGKNENRNATTIASDGVIHENYQTPMIESGAIKRGILVFVGLSMLFMGYVGFKTYRNRGKTPNIVKYGVRGRRTDMEMRPFSLEEDEEDETVFDLKHVNSRN